MKKALSLILAGLLLLLTFSGCSGTPKLDPNDPVTLTMWHVYGSQTKSPLNESINEFNHTVGREKGIVINVTSLDPGKPLLVLSAVNLEYRIVRLLLRPLPESASLTTDLLPLGDRPLTILCTDSHQLREPASAVLFFANCGYLCGQPFLASFNCVKKFQKTDKNTGNLAISGVFMVETTGLEPVTSCV